MINFTFTRNPSTKISIDIQVAGLVPADNLVVLLGRRGTETPAVKEIGTIDTTGIANGDPGEKSNCAAQDKARCEYRPSAVSGQFGAGGQVL